MAFKMKGMNHGEGTGSAYNKNKDVKYKPLEHGIQPGEYFGQFPKLIKSKVKNLFSKKDSSKPKSAAFKNVGYTKEGPKSAVFQKIDEKESMYEKIQRLLKSKDPKDQKLAQKLQNKMVRKGKKAGYDKE